LGEVDDAIGEVVMEDGGASLTIEQSMFVYRRRCGFLLIDDCCS
jgi:hypothetical protein